MNILKLTPSCKDYLWGGSRLRSDFGIKSDLNPLAEAWVLSCHPDGPSYLADGTTLADYVTAHPGCLGTDCEKFEQFPILTEQSVHSGTPLQRVRAEKRASVRQDRNVVCAGL